MSLLRIALMVLFLLLGLDIFAKDKKSEETAFDSKTDIEIGFGFAWHDAFDGAYSDAAPESKTPDFSISGLTKFFDKTLKDADFAVRPFIAWDLGGRFHTKSPSTSEPYIVLGDLSAQADLGGELHFNFEQGNSLSVSPYLGIEVLDQTDADMDYVPAGAASDDFWFRTIIEAGLKLAFEFRLGEGSKLDIGIKAKGFSDIENAYGRKPSQGYKLGLDLNPQLNISKTSEVQLDFNPRIKTSYDTGLVIQELKFQVDLPVEVEVQKLAKLAFDLVSFDFASKEQEADFFNSNDLWFQFASSLSLAFGPTNNEFSLEFAVPWLAYSAALGDFSDSAGMWQLKFGYKVEL